MTSLWSSLPWASRTTVLQPVRKPGSIASTRFLAEGGGQEELAEVGRRRLDGGGIGLLLGVQADFGFHREGEKALVARRATASRTWSARRIWRFCRKMAFEDGEGVGFGQGDAEMRKPSASPRRMARRRWEGTWHGFAPVEVVS